MAEQRREKKNHKNKKCNRGNLCGCHSAPCKSKNGRDERDKEKSQCPLQHFASSKNVLDFSNQRFTGQWAAASVYWVQSLFRFARNSVSCFISARYIALRYAQEMLFLWIAHGLCKNSTHYLRTRTGSFSFLISLFALCDRSRSFPNIRRRESPRLRACRKIPSRLPNKSGRILLFRSIPAARALFLRQARGPGWAQRYSIQWDRPRLSRGFSKSHPEGAGKNPSRVNATTFRMHRHTFQRKRDQWFRLCGAK